MSKGQPKRARQTLAHDTGRETGLPRKPASGPRAGAAFIKSRPAQLPPGSGKPSGPKGAVPHGKKPFGRDEAQQPHGKKPFGRDEAQQPHGRKPFGRDEAQQPHGRKPFGRDDAQQPHGRKPFGRDDAQQPYGKKPFGRDDAPAPRGRKPFGRDEAQQPHGKKPFGRDEAPGQYGKAPFARDDAPAPRGKKPYARSEANAPHAPKVARARKLALRDPGQKVLDRAKRLRETRVDSAHIDPVRLQKALSQSGVGSRREMEEWIAAGLVLVNGRVATLGDKVGPTDRVTVKGSPIRLKWADRLPRVILYHKQEGEMVSRDDPQGRVTVFDRLPQAKSSRWVTVGRLDVNTSGLLILTTSGELANHLMHPSFEVEREYAVRILGELTEEQIQELTQGIALEDGPAHFDRLVSQGGEGANHWYRVVIREGRNREVRRLFEHFGLQVSRLMRVRFGAVSLPPRLKRGQFYELNEVEVAAVLKWCGLTFSGSRR